MKTKTIGFAILFVFGFFGCSSTEIIQSNLLQNRIVVDGNQDDWNGKLKYFEDENIAVGFQNDDKNLYICLATADKANSIKLLSMGLTIWFEPENGEQKIGLQYPKQRTKTSPRNLMGKNRDQNEENDFDVSVKTLMQNQNEFSLINENEEVILTSPIEGNNGYNIKIGTQNQQFVYEAKIPIGNNNLTQMPIDIYPNEMVTILLESGKIDMESVRRNPETDDGMQTGGGQGSRGGMGGGRGSGKGGISRPEASSLDLELEVKLAD